jgi:crossover junction endodeoxyribonuclease RuvC
MRQPGEIVIGFDPGLRTTGYGVVEHRLPAPRLIEGGVLRVHPSGTLENRLAELYTQVAELLTQHKPQTVAVEDLYSHYERPKTAILMGHARGVIFLACAQIDVQVTSYLPTRVKKSMTGSGAATKEQMQRAIQMQFNLTSVPDPPDVADALAIALCHCFDRRKAA